MRAAPQVNANVRLSKTRGRQTAAGGLGGGLLQARGCATPDDCAAQADRKSALSRQGALATGAFALGGSALLGSVTTAFTWHNDDAALNVSLTPTGAWATVSF